MRSTSSVVGHAQPIFYMQHLRPAAPKARTRLTPLAVLSTSVVCIQGDMLCCETCPATFHKECLGLASLPEGDWWCPCCVCAVCGKNHFERHPLPAAAKQVLNQQHCRDSCASLFCLCSLWHGILSKDTFASSCQAGIVSTTLTEVVTCPCCACVVCGRNHCQMKPLPAAAKQVWS